MWPGAEIVETAQAMLRLGLVSGTSGRDMPTAVAIQCVVAQTPNVPLISGRVVKRPALMFAMRLSHVLVLLEMRV